MRTRRLGPGAGAPEVSAVGFGGMPLSIADRPPEPVAIRTIHAALDAGATLIDTADVYCLDDHDIGHNERLIAAALREWPRASSVTVATKGGLARPRGTWVRQGDPAHLHRACERSLAALGVDSIALYQLHAPDSAVPFADSVGALADLKRQGKIRRVGLSNVSVAEIDEARAIVDITSVQNRLNPWFREALTTGVVGHCARLGLGFLAYSPVGGGRLNQKLPRHPVVTEIARRHSASPHAVVIAWVLSKGPTVIPIPAARTPEHARDAMGAGGLELTGEDLRAIDRAEFSRA